MKHLIYKIKNKLFRFSKEALKIKKPSYEELIKYKSFHKTLNNKLILSFVQVDVVKTGLQKYSIPILIGLVHVKDFQNLRHFLDLLLITIYQ